jgi:Holliday junction resolvase
MAKVWAKRVDANQPAIVAELRKAGYSVAPGHDDILVGRDGITLWVEIKDGEKKKTQLKPSQVALLRDWKGAYIVATSAAEIMAWEGWQ